MAFVGFRPYHRHPDTAHKVAVPSPVTYGEIPGGLDEAGLAGEDVVHGCRANHRDTGPNTWPLSVILAAVALSLSRSKVFEVN